MCNVTAQLPEIEDVGDACMYDQMIIIDRSSDMVTALLPQLTYSGLLRETIKVSHHDDGMENFKVSARIVLCLIETCGSRISARA